MPVNDMREAAPPFVIGPRGLDAVVQNIRMINHVRLLRPAGPAFRLARWRRYRRPGPGDGLRPDRGTDGRHRRKGTPRRGGEHPAFAGRNPRRQLRPVVTFKLRGRGDIVSLLDDFTAVDFSELTPSGIEEMVITAYEEASGQTVYPSDPVAFLQSNAYIISLLAAFINETGNQRYLAPTPGAASGPHRRWWTRPGCPPACPTANAAVPLTETLGWPVLILAGTGLFNAGDGDTGLTNPATDETATIPVGNAPWTWRQPAQGCRH